MATIRLDKLLSDRGLATRRELKKLIKTGRITVNGIVETLPERKVAPEADIVKLDGVIVPFDFFRYFILNKPAGVLSVTEDRKQQTVLDLLPSELRRLGLFPVGRLDKDTTGLLILTNDGEYAHRLISPASEIVKKYAAVTDGIADALDAEEFSKGIVLRDGTRCLPAKLEITGTENCYVSVMEGKYHQVKRMLASVGKSVLALHRLSVGALALPDDLRSGEFRELSQKEKELVYR